MSIFNRLTKWKLLKKIEKAECKKNKELFYKNLLITLFKTNGFEVIDDSTTIKCYKNNFCFKIWPIISECTIYYKNNTIMDDKILTLKEIEIAIKTVEDYYQKENK